MRLQARATAAPLGSRGARRPLRRTTGPCAPTTACATPTRASASALTGSAALRAGAVRESRVLFFVWQPDTSRSPNQILPRCGLFLFVCCQWSVRRIAMAVAFAGRCPWVCSRLAWTRWQRLRRRTQTGTSTSRTAATATQVSTVLTADLVSKLLFVGVWQGASSYLKSASLASVVDVRIWLPVMHPAAVLCNYGDNPRTTNHHRFAMTATFGVASGTVTSGTFRLLFSGLTSDLVSASPASVRGRRVMHSARIS